VRHGLITTLQIDNRESSETESQGTIYVVPRVTWPTMDKGSRHRFYTSQMHWACFAEIILPANPAHQIRSCVKLALTLPKRPRSRPL
jgi:hypothetical protein